MVYCLFRYEYIRNLSIKICMISIVNLLVNCLFVKTCNIPLLNSLNNSEDKRLVKYSYDFSLIRISTLLAIQIQI